MADKVKRCDETGCDADVLDDSEDGDTGGKCGRCEEVYCQAHLHLDDTLEYVLDDYDDDAVFCRECLEEMRKKNEKRKTKATAMTDAARAQIKFSLIANKPREKKEDEPVAHACPTCKRPMLLGKSRKASSFGREYYTCRTCPKSFKWKRTH